MLISRIRQPLSWFLIFLLGYGQVFQVAALTLANSPLAASTTTVVRPNLMYVLDDSGSMGWDYTPDYINDNGITDPTNVLYGPPGSSGDTGLATIVGGVITAITATGGNIYEHGTPTVLIQGIGVNAAATVTLNASKQISSVTVTNGGSGYTAGTTYVTFLGGLKTAGWGMCWGTTSSGTTAGVPKDTSASPACTTRSQMPYSTGKINYQYYDSAVRYLPPLYADGTSYPAASTTTPRKNPFSSSDTSTQTLTSYEHEIWCSTSSPSPTPTSANIATHAQCKENLDTSNDALYPNANYTFRKTYAGAPYYVNMEPSEYCTSTDYTSCISRADALSAVPAFVVGGVTFNVPSYYRWCSYYNPITKNFGGCQGRRDLDHYIPNYLGGWVSSGTAAVQASASLVISATTAGQQLTGLTIGGIDVVGGTTFTSASNGDQNTVAANICTAIQANTSTTGYSCSVTGSTVLIQAAAVGTAANGLRVLALGPTDGAAANATGTIDVTPVVAGPPPSGAYAGLSISSITINGNQLLNANVTADGDQLNTARMICEAVNSGAQQGVYIARSGTAAGLPNWGICDTPDVATVHIKRIEADAIDNGQDIIVSGPGVPATSVSSGAIQINSTAGATSISNVTKDGVSIFTAPALAIADGTATTAIATALAAKLNGNGGCTATASGNIVTITGCTGTLVVTSSSAQATGTIKVTSTGHAYGADLGGIQVGGTTIAGHVTSTSLPVGTNVSTNATALRTAINAGTGTHGFTAAAPTLSGSDYNMVVTAPVGTAYNGQSFTFNPGTAVVAGAATSPIWNFGITGATTDDDIIDYLRCDNGSAVYFVSTDANTGTTSGCGTNNKDCTDALASGLNSTAINGYSYSCSYDSSTQNNQICNVTGPTGVSACTSDLSFTKDGTITTKSYSKLTAGTAGCGAITAPTWQFEIGLFDGATSADEFINSITCGGTNTVTPNTVTTENGSNTSNSTTRRTTLMNNLMANDINGYTYACTQYDSGKKVGCTVTGPIAAAACTDLSFTMDSNINLNFNNGVSQTCPAVVTGTSATWRFTVDDATTRGRLFNSITCGGTNTITTNTVSTGAASAAPVADRINNLVTALAANDTNGYTVSCSAATAGTQSSACTVTGPTGASACTQTDFDCAAGSMRISYQNTISLSGGSVAANVGSGTARNRYCVAPTSTGSSGASAVDDFAPYLFTLSTFSGGTPSQGTTVTPISSTWSGTIGHSASKMLNGAAPTTNTIPTNASASVAALTMSGGDVADTASNHWTGTGIFKRVDIVSTNNSYSRSSGRTDCAASTCTYAEELQNFANWYSYYRTRMQMMKSATTLAFSQLDGNYRVGFDNICQATGTTVDNPVAQFEGAARTAWWTSLMGANPNCATPLRAETAKIGRYFAHKGTSADPMQYSCQRNYMLMVTDGYWNEGESSSIQGVTGADIGNTDNDLTTAGRPYYDGAQASTTCPAASGSTRSVASSCRTLSDIAYYYYSTDLRTAALGNATGNGGLDVATNNVLSTTDDKNQAQHMNFFAMGLGIEGKLGFSSEYETALSGDFASIKAGTKNWPAVSNLDPTGVDDLWHATVNGRGKYFSARNVPNVVAGLREALNKIGARVGSAAAAATSNLEPVAGDNYAYVASYTTVDWTGDLQSRSINTDTGEVSSDTTCTTAGSGCQWSAQNKLDNLTWSARRIKIKPSSGTSGDPLRAFTYSDLSGAEQAYFSPNTLSQYAALSVSNPADISASNLVDYLRGNRGLEQDGEITHAQIWRRRSHVMGDIVNTQPVYMKAPSALYSDAGYPEFKAGTAATRKPVVFVSAQDGMLHAFNAYTSAVAVSGTNVQPGEEMWAFIPTQVLPSLKALADVNYTHRYFIDGLITVADADFGNGDWHTILIGGMGAGGTSYYALDVTDPTNPKYLWEFSTANLGYTFSNATVSKLPNGEWAVLFTSGYNNTTNGGDGVGYLYALNPQTGAVKSGYPLSTGSGSGGSPSNLGKLSVWADNPSVNNTAQYVYAGDLNGDLWRFDLDHNATGHTGTQVFKLAHLEINLTPQPITTKPELSTVEDGTRVIFVGTGKYLETADLTNTDVQGIYAIKDTLGAANLGGASQATWNPLTDTTTIDVAGTPTTVPMFLGRSLIATKEDSSAITTTINGATRDARQICEGASATVTAGGTCNNVDTTAMDWALYGGWYTTFPESGERVNVDPKLIRGSVVIASNIPSASSCTTGGDAYFTVLDFSTGLGVNNEKIVSTRLRGALAVGLTVIKLLSGDYKAIVTKSDYQQETLSVNTGTTSPSAGSSTFGSKRGLWREFEAY